MKFITKKIEHGLRLIYANSITINNKSLLVVEYPKSGGTWLTQLVSGCMNLPFPQNKMPILNRAVYHSHYQPKYRIHENKHIIWLLRDGRDIMVSSYFHYLIWNNKNKKNPRLVNYYRNKLNFEDFSDIKKNLPKFIEFLFTDNPPKTTFFNYPGNWVDYNEKWLNITKTQNNVHTIKYEDMLEDTSRELTKLFEHILPDEMPSEETINNLVSKYSFENQTKRKRGTENANSFLRKGISGDWKNYFDEESKAIFKKYAGNLLIELGYEKDMNW